MALDKEIANTIRQFQKTIAAHVPALSKEVKDLIKRKEKDNNQIEYLLDTLLSLSQVGIGESLFIQLLEYYKNVNPKAAADYWRFFEEMNE